MSGWIWDKYKIKKAILNLYRKKALLSPANIRQAHSSLFKSAEYYFGSWRKAVELCGINYDNILLLSKESQLKKSKQKIIEDIKVYTTRVKDKEKLTHNYVYQHYPRLFKRALRHFGSWRKGLEEVGVDYSKIRKWTKWDKTKVISEILSLYETGEDLSITAAEKSHPHLVHSANTIFKGQWANAIESAGLDYDKIRRDRATEGYHGHLFEKYGRQALQLLGIKGRKKYFIFSGYACYPDFVDNRGNWYDFKLDIWGKNVRKTIVKYTKHTKSLTIVYLRGNVTKRYKTKKIRFVNIVELFPRLRALKAYHLIDNISLLKAGLIPKSIHRLPKDSYQRRRFTNDRIEKLKKYIKENYNKKTYKDMAMTLGISEPAIYSLINELGLKKLNHRRWLGREEIFLKKNAENMTNEELSKALKRPRNSITSKLGKMGIRRESIWFNWTPEKEKEMLRMRRNKSIPEIARIFNTTVPTISARLCKLKA